MLHQQAFQHNPKRNVQVLYEIGLRGHQVVQLLRVDQLAIDEVQSPEDCRDERGERKDQTGKHEVPESFQSTALIRSLRRRLVGLGEDVSDQCQAKVRCLQEHVDKREELEASSIRPVSKHPGVEIQVIRQHQRVVASCQQVKDCRSLHCQWFSGL